MKKSSVAIIIIIFFIVLDQVVKIWVKTTLPDFHLGDWFYIRFVENEGMAFGISFGKNIGKLFLSLIRIGVVVFLIYYLFAIIKKKQAAWSVVIILSLIIAGALGNIIDSVFYGVIWHYAPLLYGHVVDMFYFKLFMLPEWFPLWGGEYFFPAIFNVADACTTLGIFAVIIWNKKIFISNKQEDIQQN
jgi:signal peptidase II